MWKKKAQIWVGVVLFLIWFDLSFQKSLDEQVDRQFKDQINTAKPNIAESANKNLVKFYFLFLYHFFADL